MILALWCILRVMVNTKMESRMQGLQRMSQVVHDKEKVENKQHERFTKIGRFDKRSHNCGGNNMMWQETRDIPSRVEERIVIGQGEERWKPNFIFLIL